MGVKILMVCLGNICRSPVAEGILRKMATEKNLAIEVDSAGTSGFHKGEAPDQRTQKNALKNKVDLSSLRSRQFQPEDFKLFDTIYVMDQSNLREVIKLAGSDDEKLKVKLLLNEIYPEKNLNVPDPYYGGEQGFEEVFQLIKKACEKIIYDVENQTSSK
jgi:protein-tyrosine phosphatase